MNENSEIDWSDFIHAVIAVDDISGHWYGYRELEPYTDPLPFGTVAVFRNGTEAEDYQGWMNDNHAETLE